MKLIATTLAVVRAEVMPIDVAPLPLAGKGLHVIRCLWVVNEAKGNGYARELILRSRADALRYGRENTVYVDGKEPFSGGFRTAAFCDFVKERLAAKGLL